VAALLAERGVRADPATAYTRVRAFAPRDEGAARTFRRAADTCWGVDKTSTTVVGKPAYVDPAIGGRGQVVDVSVRPWTR